MKKLNIQNFKSMEMEFLYSKWLSVLNKEGEWYVKFSEEFDSSYIFYIRNLIESKDPSFQQQFQINIVRNPDADGKYEMWGWHFSLGFPIRKMMDVNMIDDVSKAKTMMAMVLEEIIR